MALLPFCIACCVPFEWSFPGGKVVIPFLISSYRTGISYSVFQVTASRITFQRHLHHSGLIVPGCLRVVLGSGNVCYYFVST